MEHFCALISMKYQITTKSHLTRPWCVEISLYCRKYAVIFYRAAWGLFKCWGFYWYISLIFQHEYLLHPFKDSKCFKCWGHLLRVLTSLPQIPCPSGSFDNLLYFWLPVSVDSPSSSSHYSVRFNVHLVCFYHDTSSSLSISWPFICASSLRFLTSPSFTARCYLHLLVSVSILGW